MLNLLKHLFRRKPFNSLCRNCLGVLVAFLLTILVPLSYQSMNSL